MLAPKPIQSDAEFVTRQDDSAVATLSLNRPAKYNALSEEMLSAIQQQLAEVAADENIKVVVLAANGKAFCAGHDLKQMRANTSKEYYETLFKQCSEMMLAIAALPQPVIAKVQGMATAAGCQLVAACDLAVAAADVKFAVSGVNIGLFCSTPSVPLSRNVPRKRALEMLFTGNFISAQEAERYNLINKYVDADELDITVKRLAEQIAMKPRETLALGKSLYYQQIEQNLQQAYATAGDRMACNMMFDDTLEGVDAFIEKRQPSWASRK